MGISHGQKFPKCRQGRKLLEFGKYPNLGNFARISREFPYGKFPGGKILKPYGSEGTEISR